MEVVEVVVYNGHISLNPNSGRKGRRTVNSGDWFSGLWWGESRCTDRRRKGRAATKSIIIREAKQVNLLGGWLFWCLRGRSGASR